MQCLAWENREAATCGPLYSLSLPPLSLTASKQFLVLSTSSQHTAASLTINLQMNACGEICNRKPLHHFQAPPNPAWPLQPHPSLAQHWRDPCKRSHLLTKQDALFILLQSKHPEKVYLFREEVRKKYLVSDIHETNKQPITSTCKELLHLQTCPKTQRTGSSLTLQ